MENQKETDTSKENVGTSTSEKIPWNRAQLANRADSAAYVADKEGDVDPAPKATLIMVEGNIPDGQLVKIYLTLPESQQIIQNLINKMTKEEVLAIHDEYHGR